MVLSGKLRQDEMKAELDMMLKKIEQNLQSKMHIVDICIENNEAVQTRHRDFVKHLESMFKDVSIRFENV
jgi:hypothetical protein